MLSERDKLFLSILEGNGDTVRVHTLRCFMRKGDLLMAFPDERESALKTLALYQPQKLVARIYTFLIKALVRLGLSGVLRAVKLEIKETSPLGDIARLGEFGFLLGNPQGRARRVICLQRGRGGKWLVTKTGMKGAGRQTVVDEAEILRGLPAHLDGSPKLISETCDSEFASYTVELIEGRSPSKGDSPKVLECLISWQSDELVELAQLPLWKNLTICVEDVGDRAWLEEIASLKVCPTIVHGDFAPWNIKIDRSGKVHVLDWEFCKHGGAAGWDWAHYLIQVGLLVEKGSSTEVLENVVKWAQTQVGRAYLEKTGWGNEVHAWLGTYLLYTHYVLKQDRAELIECWKKNK